MAHPVRSSAMPSHRARPFLLTLASCSSKISSMPGEAGILVGGRYGWASRSGKAA